MVADPVLGGCEPWESGECTHCEDQNYTAMRTVHIPRSGSTGDALDLEILQNKSPKCKDVNLKQYTIQWANETALEPASGCGCVAPSVQT